MVAQTSYSINHGEAFEGMIADMQSREVVSRAVETAAGADFGIAVSRGTDGEKQIVIGGGATFFGITVRDLAREVQSDGTAKYEQYETANVLRSGYIWVKVPSGCAVGDAAKYADATGVIDAGAAGAGETDIVGSSFETAAAAGGLAVLRLASE